MKNIVIAIDGPVGSGKGTLSSMLAKKINAPYLYTGGMYRALALASIRAGINLENEDEVLSILKTSDINLHLSKGETKIYLGNEEVNDEIFVPEVSNKSSVVAQHPKVREEMVKRQKESIQGKSAVIEGRDIATHVAPNADLKIYLTADLAERAKRRLDQFEQRGINKTLEEVLKETEERDRRDSSREASPLSLSSDAVIIDTTHDTLDNTVNKVLEILKDKNLL